MINSRNKRCFICINYFKQNFLYTLYDQMQFDFSILLMTRDFHINNKNLEKCQKKE